MASPRRFERLTPSLGGKCSIQLSYGDSGVIVMPSKRISKVWKRKPTRKPSRCFLHGRNGGVRTRDLLVPNQAHYQAVLRPEASNQSIRAGVIIKTYPPDCNQEFASRLRKEEANPKPFLLWISRDVIKTESKDFGRIDTSE